MTGIVGKVSDALGLGWVKVALLAVLAVAVVGTVLAYNAALREQGRAEVNAKNLVAANAALKVKQKELDQQIQKTKEFQDGYNSSLQAIAEADRRAQAATVAAAVANSRLLQLTATAQRAIPGANANGVRQYASGALDLFTDCRGAYERVTSQAKSLGGQAAGASAAAHALKKSNDLLSSRPVAPIPPVKPDPHQ